MARRRFFVDTIHSQRAEISGRDAYHLTRVLRVEAGQRYEISDNNALYLAEVESARKEHVIFRVLEKLEPESLPVRMTLAAALIKFDRFEWIIEKATELGIETVIPLIAARGEKGLERAAAKRIERWRKIALEAAQQSRRSNLPQIDEPTSLRKALTHPAQYRFVLDEAGGEPLAGLVPAERHASDTVALLIGPEGGWTEEERAQFAPANWRAASLGSTILRSETAAVAALAVISAAWQVK
jgi:16S rRNA (uracil1498-N3)-methyltransferase